MTRIKREFRKRGCKLDCDLIDGCEVIAGKYPLEPGAIWAEGHYIDVEDATYSKWINVIGWVKLKMLRNGEVICIQNGSCDD